MKTGQRLVALLAACTLLLCLCACQSGPSATIPTNSTLSGNDDTESTPDVSQPTQSENALLSCDALISYIRRHGTLNGFSSDFVSDVQTEAGASAGEKKTTFTYYKGFASASVTETNEIVQTIILASTPAKFAQLMPSNSGIENMQTAYAVCLLVVEACESDKDADWHVEQFTNAPVKNNGNTIMGSYASDEWYYTTVLSDYYVSCIAARYCKLCKTNAPKVTFSTGDVICDRCGSGSQDNNDAPAAGNPQQPASCLHYFEKATCTKPETCAVCGQTNGAALGHSYSPATCTAPQTCTACSATTGSAAGHKWKAATCTEPQRCTVCKETGEAALGHWMLFTKCLNDACDHVDFSCIAGTYTNIDGYGVPVGTIDMVDLDVTYFSVSKLGELTFTYNGKNYTLAFEQNDKSERHMASFDCYLNGVLLEDTEGRAGSELYNNRVYLDNFIVDGCRLYIYATR